MALENVKKFEELLKTDEGLQAKLKELSGAYAGDMTDEKAMFEATIAKVAAEAGLPFTLDEAIEAVAEQELSDAELDAVAGGSVCYFVGGSPTVESACSGSKGAACAYAGVSFDDVW